MEKPQSEMKRRNKVTRIDNDKYKPHKLQIQVKKKFEQLPPQTQAPYNYYLDTTEIYEERELGE